MPITLAVLLVAPCIGSFIGLLADRLPVGAPVVFARSACRDCRAVLGPGDLVPVLSWIASRGRCRHCGSAVPWRYPVIEIAALVLAAVNSWLLQPWPALAGSILAWTLLALALMDVRHLILPDVLTLPLAAAGLVYAAWSPALVPSSHLAGAAAGYLGFRVVRTLHMRLRGREGLGLGDAKLMAAAGAWVSWEGLPAVLLLAAAGALSTVLLAAASGRPVERERELPFGPWLAGALWFVWIIRTQAGP